MNILIERRNIGLSRERYKEIQIINMNILVEIKREKQKYWAMKISKRGRERYKERDLGKESI